MSKRPPANTRRRTAGKPFSDRIANPSVARVFDAYPATLGSKLRKLRKLILDTAKTNPDVGALDETLKWGQPSYLTTESGSGSTIRIDMTKSAAPQYAVYFHCQTNLVETFRELYPDTFSFEGNRAIVFEATQKLPEKELRHCIGLALTYHLRNRKPAKKATKKN